VRNFLDGFSKRNQGAPQLEVISELGAQEEEEYYRLSE